LAEYHEAGLVYTNIRPSDVLITKPSADTWYPHISAYRAAQIHHKWEQRTRQFRINPERLTYVAPEQYAHDVITEKTDQYSLGLLAIEMLQGHPPAQVNQLADLEKKTAFFQDPRGYGGDWLARSPALSRVILRMVDPDPGKRWPKMTEVAEALGGQSSVEGNKSDVETNNRRIAKQSYLRLMRDRHAFFDGFYKNLFSKRGDLRSKFPSDHDWERQHAVLEAAVGSLLNFSKSHAAAEPTILTRTARSHQSLGLTADDYEAFGEAFAETLAQFGEDSEEMQGAWRACFAAGMEYMKRHASDTLEKSAG
jgi:hemoglobin-like flavoprotein